MEAWKEAGQTKQIRSKSMFQKQGDKYNKGFGSNYEFQHEMNWVGTNRNILNHD
ncbi:hypothetical protein HanRHA438_Chr10g0476811 [Helianthus annuus]|nr:hypothetical protein HanRHA438_Chr10g0476811 [Helianthus annuus]